MKAPKTYGSKYKGRHAETANVACFFIFKKDLKVSKDLIINLDIGNGGFYMQNFNLKYLKFKVVQK
jgi:hypothetical protein